MNKIVLNTIILYIKIVLNMVLSFVSVPIVLRALGAEDYGLYALVAGVVAMLAFLNSSMTVSTQRYLSVTMGTGDVNKVTGVFSCSLYLHLLIGLTVCVLFEVVALFDFDGVLNIPQGRAGAAKIIYQFLVLSTFFTIISVPYDAVLNAHENMLVFSLVTIIGALLRLVLAISLLYIHVDKLIVYGAGLACVSFIEVLLKRIYVSRSYKEMERIPYKQLDKFLFKEMFSFAGWNIIGSMATVLRNQGIAVIFNLFFGTIVNAAYGIANQVNGVLMNFSNSIQKAINPQLMKSEGANQHDSMMRLTYGSIKISEFIFGLMAVPLIIEMDTILKWWLGSVPENTVIFCRLILLMNMIMLFTGGVSAAIQARGNIKKYVIVTTSLLLLHVPIAYILLAIGYPPYSAILSMCLIELLVMMVRFIFGYYNVGLSIKGILQRILFPFVIMYMAAFSVGFFVREMFLQNWLRVFLVIVIVVFIMSFIAYWWLLDSQERNHLWKLFRIKRNTDV